MHPRKTPTNVLRMNTPAAEVAALAAILAPYLPAAIERFGSLESAVDHLVALMADDAAHARHLDTVARVAGRAY